MQSMSVTIGQEGRGAGDDHHGAWSVEYGGRQVGRLSGRNLLATNLDDPNSK